MYLFLKGQDESKAARLRIALSHVARPIISTQVINECCANLIRKAKVDRQALMHYGSILLERCDIVAIDRSVMRKAMERFQPGSGSWWDTVIVVSALSDGCSELWSEDLQHGQVIDGQMRIVNPLVDA